MIDNLLAILALSFGCFIFWQHRRQAEIAKAIAMRKCDQLGLQLLSVALDGHKLKTPQGQWRWHTIYLFEFSSLGDDCYQGTITMQGFHLRDIWLEPHRL